MYHFGKINSELGSELLNFSFISDKLSYARIKIFNDWLSRQIGFK